MPWLSKASNNVTCFCCDTQRHALGLTTLSQSNLLKFDRVQNEAIRVILGRKDTPIEAMRYLLDLPSMETRQTVEQVKVYLITVQNPKNPLHGV